jgi:hypothetical protein
MDDQNEPKPGRPTVYTPELGEAICELLAEGRTLTNICKQHSEFPAARTIRRWAIDPAHPFSPQYARAREVGYHRMADDILDISDDGTNDYRMRLDSDGEQVGLVIDHDHIARSRLRTENRKWLLSKALPKIYGDKLELNGSLEIRTHEDRLKEIAAMKASLAASAKSDEEGDE